MKYLTLIALLFSCFYLKAQHTLVLNSGEKLNCIVMSLNNDELSVIVEGKEKMVHMKEVSSIFFKEYVPYDGVLIPEEDEREIIVNGFKVKYQIKDRSFEREPKVSIGSEDKGTIVVKVVVDRYGNIRSAEPGAPGSTTSNAYLQAKAKTAAQSAKFTENLKGPLMTEGTITIIY